jgi:hypothetical protein
MIMISSLFVVLHRLTCCSFNLLQGHLSCNVPPIHIYRRTDITIIILITSVHITMSLPTPSPFWFSLSAVEERNTYIIDMFKYNACTYILNNARSSNLIVFLSNIFLRVSSFPIFRHWVYFIKVIAETRRVHENNRIYSLKMNRWTYWC